MSAHDDTNLPTDLRFAADLRGQFEGLGKNAAAAPRRRSRTLLVAGIAAACLIAVAATAAALLFAPDGGPRPGSQPQVAMVSPTAAPRHAPTPEPYARKRAPQVYGPAPPPPDVTVIRNIAIDATGRLWITACGLNPERSFIAYLDGSQWVQLPASPDVKMLRSSLGFGPMAALSPSDLWSPVGHGFARWDGTTWRADPASLPQHDVDGIVSMAAPSPSDIWAVGRQKGRLYATPGNGPGKRTLGNRPLTMHWDGATWTEVDVPALPGRTSTLQAVSSRGGETWAVGHYEEKTGELAPLYGQRLPRDRVHYTPVALRWDGVRWIRMSVPNVGASGSSLEAVLVLAPDDVWVLGAYLAHWDGHAWQKVETPQGSGWGPFHSVTGTADNDIWLGGSGSGRHHSDNGEAAHWDGVRWELYPAATFDELVRQTDSAGATSSALGVTGRGGPQIVSSSPTDVWFNPGLTRFWDDVSRPAEPVLYHWDGQGWSKVVMPL